MKEERKKRLCVCNSFNEVKKKKNQYRLCLSGPDEKKPSLSERPYTALTLGRQPF